MSTSVEATPPVANQVTPQELQAILNVLADAPSTVGRTFAIRGVIERLALLASQPHPVGAIAPPSGPAPADLAKAKASLDAGKVVSMDEYREAVKRAENDKA